MELPHLGQQPDLENKPLWYNVIQWWQYHKRGECSTFKEHWIQCRVCLTLVYSTLLHLTKQTKSVHITESMIGALLSLRHAGLTTPEARVPTSSRSSGSGNCCSLYGHELLHAAHPACPSAHVLQVEVAVAGCRRAKFSVDCTGGNRFCAYTPLSSNSTMRTRAGVRTLCMPRHMVWEIAVKKCNSSIKSFKRRLTDKEVFWSRKMIQQCFMLLLHALLAQYGRTDIIIQSKPNHAGHWKVGYAQGKIFRSRRSI